MLVKSTTSESNTTYNKDSQMENQIEKLLNGFADDVIKVFVSQSIPIKR